MSLAKLINDQEDWICTHEMRPILPWNIDEVLACDRIEYFNRKDKVADVASYYLPYVEMFLEEIEDLKVVCLKRDREQVVSSFMAKTANTNPPRNHWCNHDGDTWTLDPIWDRAFPNYDLDIETSPHEYKEELIRTYWYKYYEEAEWLSDRFYDFEVFDIDVLNSSTKQSGLFEFLDIDNPISGDVHENKLVAQ